MVLLVVGLWPLGGKVDAWAIARGVQLTDESRAWVGRRLQRARRWRTAGAALGWVLPFVDLLVQDDVVTPMVLYRLYLVLAGYLLGALVAELVPIDSLGQTSGVPDAPSGAFAIPVPVRLGALVLVALAGALAAANIALATYDRYLWPDLGMAEAGFVLGALCLLEAVPRALAKFTRPAAAGELLQSEEALHAGAVQAIVGALLAVMALAIGSQLGTLFVLIGPLSPGIAAMYWSPPGYLGEAAAAAVFVRFTTYSAGWPGRRPGLTPARPAPANLGATGSGS